MKRRLFLTSACLIACGARLFAAIDLTPAVSEFLGEGIRYQQVQFKDDDRRIKMVLPTGWSCTGTSTMVKFTLPPSAKFADASIQALSLPKAQPLDAEYIKALAQQAVTNVPAGSQGVSLVSESENPVILNGNSSIEFLVSYKMLGETFLRSTTYVNCGTTQLVFRCIGTKDEFPALAKTFRRAVFSLEWSAPPAPPTIAGAVTAPAPAAVNRP